MGQSKLPIYAYVDESGNTGRNIFDPAQPDFFCAAVICKGDFDLHWGPRLKTLTSAYGLDGIHASEIGISKIEEFAHDLHELLAVSGVHFFLSRVEKRYLLATKMFDVLFDSGENAAVAWHNYNFKPLKIMLAFKLSAVIDESIARDFWDCLLLGNEDESRKALPSICTRIAERLHILPDRRSQEILQQGLEWIVRHPEAIQFSTEGLIAQKGHLPNLVAFTNLLQGLDEYSRRWKRRIGYIYHDEQNEFGRALAFSHRLFANASPEVIHWVGESYSLQWAPGSQFELRKDQSCPGIQVADVALWIYKQYTKGKGMPPGCLRLVELFLDRGWHSDFSHSGVQKAVLEKWGDILFGPVEEDKLKKAEQMLSEAELRRVSSMKQFERDGLPPFMRGRSLSGNGSDD